MQPARLNTGRPKGNNTGDMGAPLSWSRLFRVGRASPALRRHSWKKLAPIGPSFRSDSLPIAPESFGVARAAGRANRDPVGVCAHTPTGREILVSPDEVDAPPLTGAVSNPNAQARHSVCPPTGPSPSALCCTRSWWRVQAPPLLRKPQHSGRDNSDNVAVGLWSGTDHRRRRFRPRRCHAARD